MTLNELWKIRQKQWRFFEAWRENEDPSRLLEPEMGMAWAQTVRDLVGASEADTPKVSDYEGLARLRKAFAVLGPGA